MTLPQPVWNQSTQRWDVSDNGGRVLWSAISYSDAIKFIEDYEHQRAIAASLLQTGSVRD